MAVPRSWKTPSRMMFCEGRQGGWGGGEVQTRWSSEAAGGGHSNAASVDQVEQQRQAAARAAHQVGADAGQQGAAEQGLCAGRAGRQGWSAAVPTYESCTRAGGSSGSSSSGGGVP